MTATLVSAMLPTGSNDRVALADFRLPQVTQAGGGIYRSLVDAALRDHMGKEEEPLEEMLRRVLRKEQGNKE